MFASPFCRIFLTHTPWIRQSTCRSLQPCHVSSSQLVLGQNQFQSWLIWFISFFLDFLLDFTIRFFHDSSVFTVFQEMTKFWWWEMTKFWWYFLGPLPFIDPQVVSQTSSQWVPMTASWVSGASGDAPAPGETGWGMMGHYPQGLAGELRRGNGNAKSELTLIDSSRTHTCKKNPIITHTAYPTKEKVCLMMSDQTLHDGKTPHDLTSFHRNMFPSNPLHTLPVSLF